MSSMSILTRIGQSRFMLPACAILASLFLLTADGLSTFAQTSKTETSRAAEVIQDSVDAMGGPARWLSVANASALEVYGDKESPRLIVRSVDMWSSKEARFRRDISDNNNRHTRTVTGGTGLSGTSTYSSFAALSQSYPAAALIISLEGNSCSLSLASADNRRSMSPMNGTSNPDVLMNCADSGSPTGRLSLRWAFDPISHLPLKVEIPLKSSSHYQERREVVRFQEWQAINGLMIPTVRMVQMPWGSTEPVSVSNVALGKNLPNDVFER